MSVVAVDFAEAPNAMHSEHAVLGAVLFSPGDCDDAFGRLRPEHFFDPVHAEIWRVVTRPGRAPDPGIIAEELKAHPGFVALGGIRFLAELTETAVIHSLPAHVDLILDRAARRSVADLCGRIATRARSLSEGSAEAVLADLERGASDIAREGVSAPLAVPAGLDAVDMLEAAFRGDNRGVSVGLEALDHVTGGIRQEDVWIIGARTSIGKSVFGLNLARALAYQQRGVIVFSLEMPRKEVQARLIADIAYDPRLTDTDNGNVRYSDILKGRGTDRQRGFAHNAARQLANLPISIVDVGGLNIDEIRSQALRQMRAWERTGIKAGAVLIDHIGLVRPVRKTDNKAADTSDTVNELKAIAKAVRAPVIALVQVNRGTESRQDKRPQVSDLNWSGAIEQIADLICLLYRESYYLERSTERADRDNAVHVEHELELLIHKNRSGPICNLKAFIDVACNAVRGER